MRVIAGKFRGHLLKIPKGVKIRPTSQKVKKALFDILGEKVVGSSFLELFAGSGSIGIEAKSRGAKKVIFVENNRLCIKAIARNLTRLKILYNYGWKSKKAQEEKEVILFPLDVEEAIELLAQKRMKFDFVFLDPPYYQHKPTAGAPGQGKLKNCLIKICHYDILKPQCLVIAEHSKREIMPHLLAGLRLVTTRNYGDTALSFYQVGPSRSYS